MDSEDEIVSEAFRRYFMSYAKSINKQEGRVGSLFQKNFKRKLIDNEKYFRNAVLYIHTNPQMHGLIKDFKEYNRSSYNRILLDAPSKLQKEELLAWCDSKVNFTRFHDLGFEKQGDSDTYWIED